MSDHFARVDGTTWPVNVGEVEWQLRYARKAVNPLVAASIVAAYGYLTDPTITQATAIIGLKRARKARLLAGERAEEIA